MRAAFLAATFGALVVVFVPLERVFPARPDQRVLRPAWRVDLCFFLGQYLAFAGLTTWVLSGIAGWVDAHAVLDLRAALRARPLWIQGGLALVLGDVLVYWFHRACHRYEILWRFHAVHHSAEHLDWLAAYREHPLDGLCTQICLNLPGIVLGLPFEAMGGLVVLRGLWAVFIHSNVRLPVGPLRWILGAPELHHWHHLRTERTAHNFANLAPWLDLLFGTYHRPEGPETYPLGISDPWPRGYAAQLVRPFLPAGGEAAPERADGVPEASRVARGDGAHPA
jgi:sterol desaturase/sphingolipid hydroxylase (fatty acid hydroxylase superfamily)